MRVICLAAGCSTRLLPLTRDVHKAALPVAGRPILDWQMEAFVRASLTEIVVVTGHGGTAMRQLLRRWLPYATIHVVENHEYAVKNLDWSLFCAREHLYGDTLYVEGDLILAPELLARLATSSAEVAIAADRSPRAGKVDTLVERGADGTYVLRFAEHGDLDVSAPSSQGELVCVARVSGAATKSLRGHLQRTDFTGAMALYRNLSGMMQRHSTELVDATGSRWIEIDDAHDLQRASEVVAAFGWTPRLPPP